MEDQHFGHRNKVDLTSDLIEMSEEELREFLQGKSFRGSFSEYHTGVKLRNLFCEIAAIREVSSILDLTCGTGTLLAAVKEATGATVAEGCEKSSSACEIAKRAYASNGLHVFNDDILTADIFNDKL